MDPLPSTQLPPQPTPPPPRSASEDPERIEDGEQSRTSRRTILIGLLILIILGLSTYLAYDKFFSAKTPPPRSASEDPELVEGPSPSPSMDPTATWQTYINEEQQFSLKYPRTWFTATSGDGTILFDEQKIDGQKIVEPDQVAITLEVITSEALINSYTTSTSGNKTERVINNIKFSITETNYQGDGQPPKQFLQAQTIKDDKLYQLGISKKSLLGVFDLILSTFRFTESNTGKTCIVGGCSGQLCIDANSDQGISTCEWQEEYACYKNATCKVQSDGSCGWTPTSELTTCLNKYR